MHIYIYIYMYIFYADKLFQLHLSGLSNCMDVEMAVSKINACLSLLIIILVSLSFLVCMYF